MTLQERIEAAAKGSFTENSWALLSEQTRRNRRDIVALYLTRAFPEIFSVPPTGWIAPLEADYEMKDAASDGEEIGTTDCRLIWDAMRDNWLSRHPDETNKG